MNKRVALVAVLLLAVAAAALWWTRRDRQADDFDYEAAFEGRRATDAAAELPRLTELAAYAGKPKDAVREVLGEPRRCEPGEFSERCLYGSPGIEITYIDGKADWITVPLSATGLPLEAGTLAALGLPQRAPDEVTEHEHIWRGLGGYREVRLVGADQGAIYVRIKVGTI